MNAHTKRAFQFLPLLVGAAGVAISFLAASAVALEEEMRFRSDFERRSELRGMIARESLARQENSVTALTILFQNSIRVSPEEFARAAGQLLRSHPEARAFQWIEVVSASGRALHETRRANELGHPYAIRERDADGALVVAAQRDVYWPISYTVPVETNEPALGYDLFVGPSVQSLRLAERTQEPAASRAFRIVQDPEAGLHVALHQAVYREGRLVGFVQGLFHVGSMMAPLWNASDPMKVEIVLQDVTDLPAKPAVWTSPSLEGKDPGLVIQGAARVDTLRFGGRLWTMHSAPNEAAIASRPTWIPPLVGFGGISLTALSCLMITSISRRTKEIERLVEERTRELKVARELLEADIKRREVAEAGRLEAERALAQRQRLDSLAVLAGGIAHDLNNVLAPIILAVDVVRNETNDPRLLSVLGTIRESATRGAGMVRQVLAFSRGVEGAHAPVELAPLIASVRRVFEESAKRRITLEVDVPPDAPWVMGDREHLHRAILNLLVNARDATPDGGMIRISVTRRPSPGAGPEPQSDLVVIAVQDTGTGIPPEVRSRMFEPFFSTKKPGSGNGLGLAMVDAVVRGHRGSIEVDSAEGRGSTFRLVLPTTKPPKVALPHAVEEASAKIGIGRRVLLVDDEELVLMTTTLALSGVGFKVVTARGGREALALLDKPETGPVDLLITDLVMPEGDGAELIESLRSREKYLPILVMSGFPRGERLANLASDPGIRYMTKPFTAKDLIRNVTELLATPPPPPAS